MDNDISKKVDDSLNNTFKDKFANFWYFYKWQTIIAVILLIGIAISVSQCTSNSSPDAAVMYVGPQNLFVKDKDTMADIAAGYMDDYNNDGSKSFTLLDLYINIKKGDNEWAYQNNYETLSRFNTEIAAGDSVIYILEESFYRQLVNDNCLAKLSDVLDPSMIPAETYDEYGVRISQLDFFTQEGFSSISGDLILCMRSAPDESHLNYGRTLAYWESNKVLFRSMFRYTSSANK